MRTRNLIIHPLLFALYPALALYHRNASELGLADVGLPLAAISLGTTFTWGLAWLLIRNPAKAALLCSAFWLWFFSFGHCHRVLASAPLHLTVDPTALLPGWVAVLLVSGLVVLTRKGDLHAASKAANVMALALVCLPVLAIGSYEGQRYLTMRQLGRQTAERASAAALPAGKERPPDIYYLVLDTYGRDDVLKDIYHLDNTPFLGFLERKGFLVSRRARANYGQTMLSLASSLNMTYLDRLTRQVGPAGSDRLPLTNLLNRNAAFDFLRARGYLTVGFESGYDVAEMREADVYLQQSPDRYQRKVWSTEYVTALLGDTPVSVLAQKQIEHYGRQGYQQAAQFLVDPARQAHRRIIYTLATLARFPQPRRPVFVVAHLMCPHPPFTLSDPQLTSMKVFNSADGDTLLGDDPARIQAYRDRYALEVQALNLHLQQVIEHLLELSRGKAIIILQGDHGPGSGLHWEDPQRTDMRERLGILQALYLPGNKGLRLDPEATPVNTFRTIFRYYFGAHYPPLPNESYFSTWEHPYRLLRVTQAAKRPG